jgi:hypothetical protein
MLITPVDDKRINKIENIVTLAAIILPMSVLHSLILDNLACFRPAYINIFSTIDPKQNLFDFTDKK